MRWNNHRRALVGLWPRLWTLWQDQRGGLGGYTKLPITELLATRVLKWQGGPAAFVKTDSTSQAFNWHHLFAATGFPATGGTFTAIPGGAAYDQTSDGALNAQMRKPGSNQDTVLVSVGLGTSGGLKMAVLVDLLVAASNIDTTSTSAQTVNTTALTRYTNGKGVLAFVQVVTAQLGSTPATMTLGYTNQAGTAGQTTPACNVAISKNVGTLANQDDSPFLPLQAGDTGIRSIETIQLSASMGGSGKLAVCLCKPLVWVPYMDAAVYLQRDFLKNIEGLVPLAKTSGDLLGCFTLLCKAESSSSNLFRGVFETVVG